MEELIEPRNLLMLGLKEEEEEEGETRISGHNLTKNLFNWFTLKL